MMIPSGKHFETASGQSPTDSEKETVSLLRRLISKWQHERPTNRGTAQHLARAVARSFIREGGASARAVAPAGVRLRKNTDVMRKNAANTAHFNEKYDLITSAWCCWNGCLPHDKTRSASNREVIEPTSLRHSKSLNTSINDGRES
jgi:hypothetical protein